MISPETEARIHRLYFKESWRVGTIAHELGVHHSTVRRVLSQAGVELSNKQRPARIDRYQPFILETLDKHPRLSAARLYQMVQERGYVGSPDHFRHMISRIRPQPASEAFARLKTLPGEQAQVDWADFGKVEIGRATWRLSAFLMVLSWSRSVFVRFYLSQKMSWFLWGHESAFRYIGGVPRVILYDNLKSAVVRRRGDAINFNETLLAFSRHYGFEPRPVAPYRGNEKGRVERAVRYVRDSLFAGLSWVDLEDLNAKADRWMDDIAQARPWPDDKTTTVGEAHAEERDRLRVLAEDGFACEERVEVRIPKQPYARFERNDYSVPSELVRRTLVVFANKDRIRIFDGEKLVAEHPRSFDKGSVVETAEHLSELKEKKRRARKGMALDRLQRAVPQIEQMIIALAERGENIGSMVARLTDLLDAYGSTALIEAVKEALDSGSPHPNSVRHILDRKREERALMPLISIALPDDSRIKDLAVRPHDLGPYDLLKENGTHELRNEEASDDKDDGEQEAAPTKAP